MGLPAENSSGICPKTEEQVLCKTKGCPIDCELSDWSDWSACSTTCGEGDTERTRTMVLEPANGGKECPLEVTEAAPCINTLTCPSPAPTPEKIDCEVGEWAEWTDC